MDLSDLTLEELKARKREYLQELSELRQELNEIKSEKNSNKSNILRELDERQLNFRSAVNKSAHNYRHINKISNIKLYLYNTISGIHVQDVNITCITEPELENAQTEQLFLYEVAATVDGLKFVLKYVTNKPVAQEKDGNGITNLKIRKLNLRILNSHCHKEAKESIEYFEKNPTYLGLVFVFLKDYNSLSNTRYNVIRKLVTEHKEFLEATLEDETGHYLITFSGKLYPADIFCLNWGIKWSPSDSSVVDTFLIEIRTSDEKFLADTTPLFEKLCKKKFLSKKEKMHTFSAIIIAIKDADGRFQAEQTISSINLIN